jgi:hypothetical protein
MIGAPRPSCGMTADFHINTENSRVFARRAFGSTMSLPHAGEHNAMAQGRGDLTPLPASAPIVGVRYRRLSSAIPLSKGSEVSSGTMLTTRKITMLG